MPASRVYIWRGVVPPVRTSERAPPARADATVSAATRATSPASRSAVTCVPISAAPLPPGERRHRRGRLVRRPGARPAGLRRRSQEQPREGTVAKLALDHHVASVGRVPNGVDAAEVALPDSLDADAGDLPRG